MEPGKCVDAILRERSGQTNTHDAESQSKVQTCPHHLPRVEHCCAARSVSPTWPSIAANILPGAVAPLRRQAPQNSTPRFLMLPSKWIPKALMFAWEVLWLAITTAFLRLACQTKAPSPVPPGLSRKILRCAQKKRLPATSAAIFSVVSDEHPSCTRKRRTLKQTTTILRNLSGKPARPASNLQQSEPLKTRDPIDPNRRTLHRWASHCQSPSQSPAATPRLPLRRCFCIHTRKASTRKASQTLMRVRIRRLRIHNVGHSRRDSNNL